MGRITSHHRSNSGYEPEDSTALRLQKTYLVRTCVAIIFAGILWGGLYIALGEPVAGIIPLVYSLLSATATLFFAMNRRCEWFRFVQLLLILLLPVLLMIALGGYLSSSAVVLWSLVCPFGALIFDGPRQALRWFLAYLALLFVSALIQPYVRVGNTLSSTTIIVFFVLNIGVVSTVAFVLLFHFIQQQNVTLALLRQEQAKTERLLLNVLPKKIAALLRDDNHQGTIAEYCEAVSVLFADVVGFTPLSAELAPRQMVELLNEVFSHFDSLVEKYGLEKIRTIGDNYMVVSGAPAPRSDHAHALAHMALDMMSYVHDNHVPGVQQLQFRIGINSGAAVAGVIGHHKFHYDLWGDAVNVASRMESQGIPGKIQITDMTYALLKDRFTCQPRGTIEIKGKGKMQTWFLTGAKREGLLQDSAAEKGLLV